nr:MAG TPA: Merozoite Surface Antigen 2 (MSA-2) family [Caudoviricetes sp.]
MANNIFVVLISTSSFFIFIPCPFVLLNTY